MTRGPLTVPILGLLLAAGAHIAQVRAQTPPPHPLSAAEILKNAQAGAPDITQLKAAFHSPDQSVRLAALSGALDSHNAPLVALAISEGYASSDEVMRNLAARAAFAELKHVAPEPTSTLSDADRAHYAQLAVDFNWLLLEVQKYDAATGLAELRGNYSGSLALSASRLEFKTGFCHAVLRSSPGSWVFEGPVTCAQGTNNFNGNMRVQIR
jgi:hypothetical protein